MLGGPGRREVPMFRHVPLARDTRMGVHPDRVSHPAGRRRARLRCPIRTRLWAAFTHGSDPVPSPAGRGPSITPARAGAGTMAGLAASLTPWPCLTRAAGARWGRPRRGQDLPTGRPGAAQWIRTCPQRRPAPGSPRRPRCSRGPGPGCSRSRSRTWRSWTGGAAGLRCQPPRTRFSARQRAETPVLRAGGNSITLRWERAVPQGIVRHTPEPRPKRICPETSPSQAAAPLGTV